MLIDLVAQGGRHLAATIARVLCATHTLSVVGEGSFCRRAESDFLLWEPAHLHAIASPAAILLLSEPVAGELELSGQVVAVANSQCPALLTALAGQDLRVLSCGLQTTDTLTLSSYTGESAVVNLQRSISTFGGEVVEASEFPLALSCRQDPFTILAVAAIYLLSGNQTELSHLTI